MVETPLAISKVTLLLPIPIVSPKINLLFSKIEIDEVECPKLILMVPSSFSSLFKDERDEDKGEGI